MLKVEFSDEFKQSLANEIKNQLLPVLLQELKQEQLPLLLTRRQFMELAGIGESKCAELFHRPDFPVNRELGHPRVVTKDLFQWLHETNQNAREVNLRFPYEAI